MDEPSRVRAAQWRLFAEIYADSIDETVDMGLNGEDDALRALCVGALS